MSGGESFMENAGGSEIQESPARTSMCLPYTADGTATYAPPVSMLPPPNNSSESAQQNAPPVYQPDTGVSVGAATAAAAEEVQPQPPDNNNNSGSGAGEVMKRKRGRPRKYSPSDGIVAPVLSSPPPVTLAPSPAQGSSGKKARGRPPGSGRKHKVPIVATPGPARVGFTPHIINVKAGEDVLAKLMSFSQHNAEAVCILSANGAISNVTLRQAASSGGTVTYEGRFDILSLSGSFLLSESGGQRSRTGGLSVSLAGHDGQVLGGGVAGLLTAACPVQVVVGSFMATVQQPMRSSHNEVYAAAPKLISGVSVGGSPPSRAALSESSGGPGSPLNYVTGGCNNNNNSQTIPNVTWR